ncbi:MAG: hypothetical protein RIR27_1065 [Pseudomonadota bacterium]
MSGVSQIRMQAAASRLNSDSAQLGAKPSGTASPGGFENFLAALNQSTITRLDARGATDKKSTVSADPNTLGMQNLPTKDSQGSKTANNADPMQLLMSQLMAQTMLSQAVAPQNQTSAQQSADTQQMVSMLNPQAGLKSQDLLGLGGNQGIDPKQAALITQALSKALKASGQATDQNSQAQALALLQAFQSQMQSGQTGNLAMTQAADQAKAQLTAQNAAQIASAIQTAAQKNGIELPPELQAQLNELVNQATPGSIKLLGVESDAKASVGLVSTQAGQVDPAKATTIQNLTDAKNQKIADTAALDKNQKPKVADSLTPLSVGEKSAAAKAAALEIGKSEGASHDASKNVLTQSFDPSLNPAQTGISPLDSGVNSQNRIEVKASEVSLASGPLHAEIMNSAKSGGGRIMLELTPPEQGTIRIDLRINASGQAHLIVEGASDATKARLDQGGQNLKNEFSQMGLNLSLDLRQGNQSQQASQQGFGNARQGTYSGLAPVSQNSASSLLMGSARSGDNRESSNTVHLYA